MDGVTVIEVTVCIAVSDCGNVLVSVPDECNVQRRAKHQQWLEDLKASNHLWVVKTVKTLVPFPMQYEEIPLERST
jgi:hypothetical protein